MLQVIDGFPRLLRRLQSSDHVLVVLYWRGAEGATHGDLDAWVRPEMRKNLQRTLRGLDAKDFIHLAGSLYVLTRLGERDVEQRDLLAPV